jgi:DNA-binding transcriptional LysR family regulator
MVEADLGVGLVPEYSAARYTAACKLVAVQLDEPWAERQWKLCVRSLASLSAPARLLVKHLSGV